MSCPHKTHLELLAGPYLRRRFTATLKHFWNAQYFHSLHDKERILWEKEDENVNLLNRTFERSSLPVGRSLHQVQSGWARAGPIHLSAQSQRLLIFPQWRSGESTAEQIWWKVSFSNCFADWHSELWLYWDSPKTLLSSKCQGVHFLWRQSWKE